MSTEALQKLLDKYLMGTITPGERERLLTSLKDEAIAEEVKALLLQDIETGRFESEDIPAIRERLNENLAALINSSQAQALKTVHRVHFLQTSWFKYAAAILIMLGFATYLWINNGNNKELVTKAGNNSLQTDVGKKAVLTLADGSKIVLDNTTNGNLAQQGNTQVVKLSDGKVVYNLQGKGGKDVMWNTMSTPVGGQYQVALPDGTTVWLNAASSITFPTAFMGSSRLVKITGEVYFEIAKDKELPFIVNVDDRSTIQVLGTSFNINSYSDEGFIKTTLLEGSVKVISAVTQQQKRPNGSVDHPYTQSVILKPGQQATIDSSISVTSNADVAQALAWKNGLFNFNGSDLRSVMRQLERWYGIKVQYEEPVPNDIFKGEMYRTANLADVLDMLHEMGVKFRIEGKVLIVTGI